MAQGRVRVHPLQRNCFHQLQKGRCQVHRGDPFRCLPAQPREDARGCRDLAGGLGLARQAEDPLWDVAARQPDSCQGESDTLEDNEGFVRPKDRIIGKSKDRRVESETAFRLGDHLAQDVCAGRGLLC